MHPFRYQRVASERAAIEAASERSASYVAGGTSILDLMKLDIERPSQLVDINPLGHAAVEEREGRIWIGALARNSDVAYHPLVTSRLRAVSEALLSGASPQIRNMASTAGNLLQRTRCPYFRELGAACNKRAPGSGCSALGGYNRSHAVLGGSDQCIAVHPSDFAVALVALDASVHLQGPAGPRVLPMTEFHRLPAAHPELETALASGELITHVSLPNTPFFAGSRYFKVRDRASFAFALASVAVALEVREGKVHAARVAFGGVGTKPWRSREAEQSLLGQVPNRATFERAAQASVAGAKPQKDNAFKVPLIQRTLVRALEETGGFA